MNLKFKKLHPNAQLPVYATKLAAGMDVFACLDEPIMLQGGEAASIPTGIAMELPCGFEAQFRGRSGLAFKHAVFSFNGTIDADYRGEIKGLLINHSHAPFTIEPGMRIGQLVVNCAFVKCYPEFAEEINETERGDKGFGSTGLKDPPIKVTEDKTRTDLSGYMRYYPEMGDNPPSTEEIKDELLNASMGKK